MGDQLKPCPFCGSDDLESLGSVDGEFIACQCGAYGPMEMISELAVISWNNRADTNQT